jgi:acyl carrier protein
MNQLEAILQEIRPEYDFTESQDFIADQMLDSFDLVTLVSELDRRLGISIDGADIVPDNFRNLAAIRSLLAKYGK